MEEMAASEDKEDLVAVLLDEAEEEVEHMRWWTRGYTLLSLYGHMRWSIWAYEVMKSIGRVYGDGDLVYVHHMNIYLWIWRCWSPINTNQHKLMNTLTITFGSHNSKLSVDEKTNWTFMHFWWMFFSSSLAKMKWAEVETYMIIFGFVLFSGLARWKIFSIEIMIDIPNGSDQNWPPKRFGSKLTP